MGRLFELVTIKLRKKRKSLFLNIWTERKKKEE